MTSRWLSVRELNKRKVMPTGAIWRNPEVVGSEDDFKPKKPRTEEQSGDEHTDAEMHSIPEEANPQGGPIIDDSEMAAAEDQTQYEPSISSSVDGGVITEVDNGADASAGTGVSDSDADPITTVKDLCYTALEQLELCYSQGRIPHSITHHTSEESIKPLAHGDYEDHGNWSGSMVMLMMLFPDKHGLVTHPAGFKLK